jgi:hypothetical protein
VKVLVEGKTRAQITRFDGDTPHFTVEAIPLPDPDERSVEWRRSCARSRACSRPT